MGRRLGWAASATAATIVMALACVSAPVHAGRPLTRSAVLQGQTPRVEYQLAKAAMKAGKFPEAVMRLNQLASSRPKAPKYKRDLAEVYSLMGRCDDAMVLVDYLRSKERVTWRVAAAEGRCRLRMGDLSGSIVAFEEAAELDPEEARRWGELALGYARAGRSDDANEVIETCYLLDPELALGYDLRVQYELGAEAKVDLLLELLRYQSRGWGEDFLISVSIDAQRSLDLDDCVRAVEQANWLTRRVPDNERGLALRAEAYRRMGDAAQAWVTLYRPIYGGTTEIPMWLLADARLAADDREFERAGAQLARAGVALLDDATQTAWYLAWRAGDQAEMAKQRDAWEEVNSQPSRRLELLIPWPERSEFQR